MDNLIALILTIVLELLVIIIIAPRPIHKYLIPASVIFNIITNVPLNFILQWLAPITIWLYLVIVLVLEIIVILVEWIGYHIIIKDRKKAFLYSLAANTISFVIGSIILNNLF